MGGGPVARQRGDRLAVRASRVRAQLLFILLDAVAVLACYGIAEVAYFRDHPPALYFRHFLVFIVVAMLVHLVLNRLLGLYGRIWRHAGIEEARQVLVAGVAAVVTLLALTPLARLAGSGWVPPQVIPLGGVFVLVAMGALRFHSRLFAWQRGTRLSGLRVAVIGSRASGAAAIREMLRSPGIGLVPTAVFDDDPRGHGLSLLGVPVVGGIDDLEDAVPRYNIQQVLLAIPEAAPELVERVLAASSAAGVTMKILPSVREVVSGSHRTTPIKAAREPRIEDLLGRTTVSTDLEAVMSSLAGRRVLITGAGGSIGSEISRQVAKFGPAELLLLDRDETHLHDTVATMDFPAQQLLLDVSDRAAVFEAFLRHRPEVVFHAAAHKHVPVLEHHPIEAVKVNVFGTLNLVDASAAVNVGRFVLISTDKAVQPTSVMGASKRLAEQVLLSRAPESCVCSVVRFGNVLGSRGSVIPTFARQIAAGGPVTVTDPQMTRFFMSVEEAVQLVLQASVLADRGEIFMLEMGAPVRILELAARMIRLSGFEVGVDVAIEIVGRRPGEKMHEELAAADEVRVATEHPAIHRLVPPGHCADQVGEILELLRQAVARRDGVLARQLLFDGRIRPPGEPLELVSLAESTNGANHPPAPANTSLANGHRNGHHVKALPASPATSVQS